VDPDRTDAGFRLRTNYLKYLYPYERKFFLGLGDDDFDFAAFERMLTKAAGGPQISMCWAFGWDGGGGGGEGEGGRDG
jgi:hypothetical protein